MARVDKIAVVLDGNDGAKLFPCSAHSRSESASQVSTTTRLALPEASCRFLKGGCESAKARIVGDTELGRDLVSSLDALHAFRAHGLVGGRVIVAHTRAADGEAEINAWR